MFFCVFRVLNTLCTRFSAQIAFYMKGDVSLVQCTKFGGDICNNVQTPCGQKWPQIFIQWFFIRKTFQLHYYAVFFSWHLMHVHLQLYLVFKYCFASCFWLSKTVIFIFIAFVRSSSRSSCSSSHSVKLFTRDSVIVFVIVHFSERYSAFLKQKKN